MLSLSDVPSRKKKTKTKEKKKKNPSFKVSTNGHEFDMSLNKYQ